MEGAIRPDNAHLVRTRLVCLENTHNMAGGRIQPYQTVEAISRWARQHGLATHLDGARLLNAVVATGIPVAEWAQHFDTVSLCFSKGLGAPVGSILVGPRQLITAAHRRRKFLGGGMRQAGVLAAAALHALEHHVDRLADDHQHARSLAEGIATLGGLQLEPEAVDTNIIVFQVEDRIATAQRFVDTLATHGVRMLAVAPPTCPRSHPPRLPPGPSRRYPGCLAASPLHIGFGVKQRIDPKQSPPQEKIFYVA